VETICRTVPIVVIIINNGGAVDRATGIHRVNDPSPTT